MPHLPISVGSQWVPKEGGEWGIEAIIHGSKKNQSPIVREHRKMDAIPFAISILLYKGLKINGTCICIYFRYPLTKSSQKDASEHFNCTIRRYTLHRGVNYEILVRLRHKKEIPMFKKSSILDFVKNI